ncbi:MAG: ribbon-helix-helix protein, CopG family [Deltaproteobacteria bacterium]|nr:ribbon-helix-helix protein, CopG family [Deltaproteobacteria bacterium]
MQTKLTLRLDDELIRKVKRHSAKSGKSVSQMVEDYFALIDAGKNANGRELTPRVRSLLGALAGSRLSEDDYKRHIEAKHR